jgi:hypothetical protein
LPISSLLLLFAVAGCGGSDQSTATPDSEPAAEPVATNPEAEPADAAGEPSGPPVIELDAETLLAMRLAPEELEQGWVRLFDGSTLYGWSATGNANWSVRDGTIHVGAGEQSLLCTSLPWTDFECRVEFRAAADTNSGVFLRTPLVPNDPAADCYELNIAPDDHPFPTGSLVGRKKVEMERRGELDADAWHRYEIRAEGPKITISLDGQTLYTYTDPNPITRGRIALQHNSGEVAFREVLARPLGFRPLLPRELEAGSETIAGWKRYPEMEGTFEVTEQGHLRALGGKNQLETEQQFADFALLVEAKTAGPEQNSGIFFRCIPGEEMNGYECQINNDASQGNPLLPADCGTGGIFRRQDARIIAADNGEWFHLLLLADGPHMAAWVNGIQVSEFTDTREPDRNPRRGRRLEAGTIILQAHDPGTDVRFRRIDIAPR